MKTFRLTFLTMAALTLTACHDDGPVVVDLAAVVSGTQKQQATTRATGTDAELQVTQFVEGMGIQIECYDHTANPNDASDHTGCVAYDNSTGVYTTGTLSGSYVPLSGTVYYPASGHPVDIRAYYPATVTSATTVFPATGDITAQTTLAAYQGFDLMYATPHYNLTKGETHLLTFHHAMAQIIVNISPGVGVTAEDISTYVTAVTVNNTVPVATLTNTAGVITAEKKAGEAVADISIFGTGDKSVGLIVPQTVAKGSPFITVTYAGNTYTYSLPDGESDDDKTFTGGYKYIYTFTMRAAELVLESEKIVDWATGETVTHQFVI